MAPRPLEEGYGSGLGGEPPKPRHWGLWWPRLGGEGDATLKEEAPQPPGSLPLPPPRGARRPRRSLNDPQSLEEEGRAPDSQGGGKGRGRTGLGPGRTGRTAG